MSDLFVEITESNWETEVVQSETPVLLDFWAPWCLPCKALEPTLVGLAGIYAGRVKFGKVNLDQNPSVAGRFGVRGIPHLQLMRGDVQVGVLSARTRTRLMVELDALLA